MIAPPGLVTLTEAAAMLGIENPRSARKALDRAGVRPVDRAPGRGGQNMYRRADVAAVRRPGQGARTDLNPKDSAQPKGAPPS